MDVVEDFAAHAAPKIVEQVFESESKLKGVFQSILVKILEQGDSAMLTPAHTASYMGLGSVEQAFSTEDQLRHDASTTEGEESGLGASIHAPTDLFRPQKKLPVRPFLRLFNRVLIISPLLPAPHQCSRQRDCQAKRRYGAARTTGHLQLQLWQRA